MDASALRACIFGSITFMAQKMEKKTWIFVTKCLSVLSRSIQGICLLLAGKKSVRCHVAQDINYYDLQSGYSKRAVLLVLRVHDHTMV